jgi:hypothetical protein
VLSGGYQSNDSTSFDVTLVSGQTYGTNDDTTFLNYQKATKSGIKFHDLNANGVKDMGEAGLAGWTIAAYADTNGNGVLDQAEFDAGAAATDTTDVNGAYSLELNPGKYIVVETLQSGWFQSFPGGADELAAGLNTGATTLGADGYAITLTSGQQDKDNDFGNARFGKITIIKDTVPDAGPDFTFTGDLGSFDLDDDGETANLPRSKPFVDLLPGTYKVSEIAAQLAALGYILTSISIAGDNGQTTSTVDLANLEATIKLDPGENVEVTFKNTSRDHIRDLAPCIEVEKLVSVDGGAFFDADLPLGPIAHKGDSISYKYLVTAEDGPLTNVVLVDDKGTASTADDFNPAATLVGGFNIGDANKNNILEVGETWEYTANGAFKLGLFTNIATARGDFSFKVDDVTFTGTATDTDAANVWGVNTKVPCYWRTCAGLKQWDGRGANDLLVDTDGNGRRDGLIIGDLNFNKVEDGSENTLIISKYAALSALRATGSGEPQLKKELVAAWLNASMTNNGDHFNLYEDGDGVLETCEPGFWINQAVLWLAEVAPLPGTANALSTAWLTGVDLDGSNSITPDTESGQKIWENLFQYNKDGTLLDPCDDTSVDNPCTIAFDPPYDNLIV